MSEIAKSPSDPSCIRRQTIAMNLSLGAAVFMLVAKLTAYFLSGSTAILSDAAESVVHIFATAFAAFGLFFARKPADRDHPYGHGKIVQFSIGFEGLLILAAAIVIIYEAARAFVTGPELQELGSALLITAVAGLINLCLGLHIISVGKQTGSPALIANGRHLLTDMVTSFSVVAGVTVVWLTNYVVLDPIVAVLSAMFILITGAGLIRNAISEAMEQVSVEDTETIKKILADLTKKQMISGYHQLRHRKVNVTRWIEVHILIPGDATVSEGHKAACSAEKLLREAFPLQTVYATTHVEPDEHFLAHPEGHREDPLTS